MKNLVPVLPSKNIPESLEFYGRVYGFRRAWAYGRDQQPVAEFQTATATEIIYGGLSEPMTVHFWFCDVKQVLESCGFRIEVSEIEAIYAACQAVGCVHPNAPLETKPWGLREFGTLDPSGVLVTVFQTLD